jgi:hypothetical protein
MTNGQIAQLQELGKCYMKRRDASILYYLGTWGEKPFTENAKYWLRRLMHQYAGQIAAMKRNRTK